MGDFISQTGDRFLCNLPDQCVVDFVVVSMCEPVSQADDPMNVGYAHSGAGIRVTKTTQSLANDLKVPFDRLSYQALLKICLNRHACRIFNDVATRPLDVFKQLRRFRMHRR